MFCALGVLRAEMVGVSPMVLSYNHFLKIFCFSDWVVANSRKSSRGMMGMVSFSHAEPCLRAVDRTSALWR